MVVVNWWAWAWRAWGAAKRLNPLMITVVLLLFDRSLCYKLAATYDDDSWGEILGVDD